MNTESALTRMVFAWTSDVSDASDDRKHIGTNGALQKKEFEATWMKRNEIQAALVPIARECNWSG